MADDRGDGRDGDPVVISARAVGSGAAWNVLAYTLPQGFTLVLSVAVGRFLGPSLQGVQSFIVFTAVTAGTVFSLGLPLSLQRWISHSASSSGRGLIRPVVLRCYLAAMGLGAVAAAATLTVGQFAHQEYRAAWVMAAVYAAASVIHSVSAQGMLGMHRFRSASIVGLTLMAIAVPISIVVLMLGGGVTGMIAVSMGASVPSAILTCSLLVRHLPATAADESDGVGSALRTIRSFALAASLTVVLDIVVNQRSEFVVLAAFHPDEPEQLAFYSVAFAAAGAAARAPAALVSVVVTAVASLLGAGDGSRVRSGYARAQRMLAAVGAPAAGLSLGVSSSLVVLAYGPAYEPAARVVLVAVVVPVLIGPMGGLATAALIGSNRIRASLLAQAVGASATVASDVLLIPPFAAIGAALANSIGQLVATTFAVVIAQRALRLQRPDLRRWFASLMLGIGIAVPGVTCEVFGVSPTLTAIVGLVSGAVALGIFWPIAQPLRDGDLDMLSGLLERVPSAVTRWIRAGEASDARQ